MNRSLRYRRVVESLTQVEFWFIHGFLGGLLSTASNVWLSVYQKANTPRCSCVKCLWSHIKRLARLAWGFKWFYNKVKALREGLLGKIHEYFCLFLLVFARRPKITLGKCDKETNNKKTNDRLCRRCRKILVSYDPPDHWFLRLASSQRCCNVKPATMAIIITLAHDPCWHFHYSTFAKRPSNIFPCTQVRQNEYLEFTLCCFFFCFSFERRHMRERSIDVRENERKQRKRQA